MRAIVARRTAAYLATDAQKAYLRRLLNSAYAHHMPYTGFDPNHLERVTKAEASAEIDRLKGLQAAGWPRKCACGHDTHIGRCFAREDDAHCACRGMRTIDHDER